MARVCMTRRCLYTVKTRRKPSSTPALGERRIAIFAPCHCWTSISASPRFTEVVRILLQAGVDINAVDTKAGPRYTLPLRGISSKL